jgi:putative ATP-binding cassette transporter
MKASMRDHLQRCRQHAEEIALYRGEKFEHETAINLYSSMQSNAKQVNLVESLLAGFRNSVQFLTAVVPYVVLAKEFFQGTVEMGDIAQTVSVYLPLSVHLSLYLSLSVPLSLCISLSLRISEYIFISRTTSLISFCVLYFCTFHLML